MPEFTWPNVRPGEPLVQGEHEPDEHFAERLAFAAKVRSVQFGGSVIVQDMKAQGNQEARDMAAYKSLRDQGYQPPGIDGCAARVAHARGDYDVDVAARVNRDREVLADKGLEFTR